LPPSSARDYPHNPAANASGGDRYHGQSRHAQGLLDRLREHTRGFPRALEAIKGILDPDHTLTTRDLLDRLAAGCGWGWGLGSPGSTSARVGSVSPASSAWSRTTPARCGRRRSGGGTRTAVRAVGGGRSAGATTRSQLAELQRQARRQAAEDAYRALDQPAPRIVCADRAAAGAGPEPVDPGTILAVLEQESWRRWAGWTSVEGVRPKRRAQAALGAAVAAEQAARDSRYHAQRAALRMSGGTELAAQRLAADDRENLDRQWAVRSGVCHQSGPRCSSLRLDQLGLIRPQ
jgi:hypothetical protein